MLINQIKIYISISLAAKNPLKNVATKGVFNFIFIFPKNLKINPSEAIAYKMRGKGSIPPNKLVERLQIAPL